jgi:hypothetical protein
MHNNSPYTTISSYIFKLIPKNAAKAIYKIGCFLKPKIASANTTPRPHAFQLNNKFKIFQIDIKKSPKLETLLNA